MTRGSSERGPGTLCSKCLEREIHSRGLCDRCYGYERKAELLPKVYGEVKPRVLIQPEDKKRCRICGLQKLGADFYNEKKASDGKQSACKKCNYALTQKWKAEHPERHKVNKHKSAMRYKHKWRYWKYGLTQEAYDAQVEAQDNLCALCGELPNASSRGLVVDHDHDTGLIRGLLCSGCNSGLGLFGDSIEGLERAIAYLRRSEVTDIRKSSKSSDVELIRQGHTSNESFGSSPTKKVKGGRPVRDLTIPSAKR